MIEFDGECPPAAPWGQEEVLCSPDLVRRLDVLEPRRPEVCVVFGAGGALGPDVVHALLRRSAVVIGIDKQLTYWVKGAQYRKLDLNDSTAVRAFFHRLRDAASASKLSLGPIIDLATIQTSATDGTNRGALVQGKQAVVDALCDGDDDVRFVYMSTAEVYGAPEGAPYGEGHAKEPINVYGRHKLAEERAMMDCHGRATRQGKLHIVALRTWTISMVNYDASGAVVATRNYNDPMIALAEKMARAGVRLPVADPDLYAQFHRAEEVAEVLVRLGEQSHDSPSWGQAYNCIGQPTKHGTMRDICFEVFKESGTTNPFSAMLSRGADVLEPAIAKAVRASARWAHSVNWLGATRFGERLPFLYRSTQLDSAALQQLLGDALATPQGTTSEEAVKVLCRGLQAGGPNALNLRRYGMY